MLIHDQQVRLTHRERDILHRLTGSDPKDITTRDELRAWAERYLQTQPGETYEITAIKGVLRRYLPV
ncbi:hypothetical protein [Marinobacter zhejiangensis]|uniref:Uncharacterized protein n=1 Tax=Marinobacter zhejiangensis TaxID=488535 RepID=A0A1I4NMY0_9GAMM|nr:hypothetical protein [Marinobacter zhejiangensis]SFM16715.1 hypothetical protein SAMN04487963_1503 [Marinobacter zhejiangensis]